MFFFFFYGATARCRALASRIKPLHSSLSCAALFQFLTPINIFASSSTAPIHLDLCLPARLLPPIVLYNIFFGKRSLSIFCTCPAHCNLLFLLHFSFFCNPFQSLVIIFSVTALYFMHRNILIIHISAFIFLTFLSKTSSLQIYLPSHLFLWFQSSSLLYVEQIPSLICLITFSLRLLPRGMKSCTKKTNIRIASDTCSHQSVPMSLPVTRTTSFGSRLC
jgi:hypothetical protein